MLARFDCVPIVNPGTFIHTALVLRNKFVAEHTPDRLGESSFIIQRFLLASARSIPFSRSATNAGSFSSFSARSSAWPYSCMTSSGAPLRRHKNFFCFGVISTSVRITGDVNRRNLPLGDFSLGLRQYRQFLFDAAALFRGHIICIVELLQFTALRILAVRPHSFAGLTAAETGRVQPLGAGAPSGGAAERLYSLCRTRSRIWCFCRSPLPLPSSTNTCRRIRRIAFSMASLLLPGLVQCIVLSIVGHAFLVVSGHFGKLLFTVHRRVHTDLYRVRAAWRQFSRPMGRCRLAFSASNSSSVYWRPWIGSWSGAQAAWAADLPAVTPQNGRGSACWMALSRAPI